ncbi:EF-hand calcium-binding domain-containing 14-like isoform X2 [Labeo rohita]|uniref:EF-hand calcium-binding domain-containing 14-like isoform X2 n=1 Tax=Labeo rohita TaxID=84645 RepID=A0A498MF09_LABRO|nr:EF-hand calcium-binding domain-containing 14-like isoform X2 [Labeo rohita]
MSPQKKMKKRKELNALIGLSDSSRKKSKQSCGHRLLRTEPPETGSESSSEEQEFGGGGRSGLFGKSSVQCCSLCYPLCVFIVLAACVMACAGLIWMQIALKEDLDSMKEKIHIMETSQKLSSHEILKLSEDLKAKQMKLDDMESGDKGLAKLWSNLSEINQKLSALDSAVNHLKANIKSASDLIALPRTVEELQKHLQDGVKELNGSLMLHESWSSEQIQSVRFVLSNLSRWVSALEQSSSGDTQPTATRPLQALQTTADAADAGSSPSRRPRFLSRRRYKREQTSSRRTALIHGVESESDVEQLLRGRSSLTSEELKEALGSEAPDSSLLAPYDADGDGLYSLEELQAGEVSPDPERQ